MGQEKAVEARSRLSSEGKIIVEVGLNELVLKAEHPHVSCLRDEAIADIVACAREGAAVVHVHARDRDESNAWLDDGYYRDVMDGVAEHCDVLVYPTYNHADLSAVRRLHDSPGNISRIAIAPFDIVQEVSFTVWDEAASRFVTEPPANLLELNRRKLNATIAVFDIGHARWAGLAARAGLLTGPPPTTCDDASSSIRARRLAPCPVAPRARPLADTSGGGSIRV